MAQAAAPYVHARLAPKTAESDRQANEAAATTAGWEELLN
jgi:hypothetical protein